jgi:hypothetical protein
MRPVVEALALLAVSVTTQGAAHAGETRIIEQDPYTDFGLVFILNEQPLPVVAIVDIIRLIGDEFPEPFDINSLNITFNPADDQNDPQPL